MASLRRVTPELLDDLSPDDPRAERSRRDLRRVHRVMRSVAILRRAIERLVPAGSPPQTLIELGAGDGSLLLRHARTLRPRWQAVELTLLDRHDIVAPATRLGYETLGWKLSVTRQDALAWALEPAGRRYDVCIANLFLHHFDAADLLTLLRGVGARCDAFIACEPRRDLFARLGSSCIGLLGANAVTREDSVTSVAAGFREGELSHLWSQLPGRWRIDEYRALPFTHCFTARRLAALPEADRP